jgi:hypothetical protein
VLGAPNAPPEVLSNMLLGEVFIEDAPEGERLCMEGLRVCRRDISGDTTVVFVPDTSPSSSASDGGDRGDVVVVVECGDTDCVQESLSLRSRPAVTTGTAWVPMDW